MTIRLRASHQIAVALMALAIVALAPVAAFAYTDEDIPCTYCHGADFESDPQAASSGPHGGFTATSKNCGVCHLVHNAGQYSESSETTASILLLPSATIRGTCLTCHDATGAGGVYGNIAARGLAVESSHSIDTTNVVPGGDAATGGSREETFTGVAGQMSCDDCHSPHGTDVVAPFLGDRMRGVDDTMPAVSTKLLKQRPTGAESTVAVYGSDWCASCHRGRLSGGPVHNHPVDSTDSTGTPFNYSNVAKVESTTSLQTSLGPLGQDNFGYVLPYPRSTEQTGHAPICQQCHEDYREVGAAGQVATYTVSAPFGTNPNDNPQFQDFPHESAGRSLLLEDNDDLCTNCHEAADLP